MTLDAERDLEIVRIIKASPAAIWAAWTNPASFEQWWVPAPARCQVKTMDVRPGGALVTQISDGGGPFGPHVNACYLEVEPHKRLVFTNALVGGWRPAEQPFMTAIITLDEHEQGTTYRSLVMHRNTADRDAHRDMGFYDGWGTVAAQLARLVEN